MLRKRAAPVKAIGGRWTSKESRKHARKPKQSYAQVQQATEEDDDEDDSSACIPSHYEQFTGGV